MSDPGPGRASNIAVEFDSMTAASEETPLRDLPCGTPRDRAARDAQRDRIIGLLAAADEQAELGRDAEAIAIYYRIFNPEPGREAGVGYRRIAPLPLYAQAAAKLQVVASRHALRLIDGGCLLAGDPGSDIVGVPRGALNLYLISNQYEVFTELALRHAAQEFLRRDIKRFLMSSLRARLGHLRNVQACAPLLDQEQGAFSVLADFESRLQQHLAPLRRDAGAQRDDLRLRPPAAHLQHAVPGLSQ